MKCPKCSAAITARPDENGYLNCPGCGARLRSKSAAGPRPPAMPTPVAFPAPAPAPPPLPMPEASESRPPITPLAPASFPPSVPHSPEPAVSASLPSGGAPAGTPLDELFAELRVVRRVQEEILQLLKGRSSSAAASGMAAGAPIHDLGHLDDDPEPARPAATRGGSRRVVLVDDDMLTRSTAQQLMARSGMDVVAVATGNEAIAVIAANKPAAIVLEIGIEGAMPGRDFVNIVKATMEWVDIPLVLFTRVPIADEEEARTQHGADQFVQKGSGAEALLVQRMLPLLG